MTWPLLISVPHAGLAIPPELKDICLLTPEQIAKDGDEEADVIYDLKESVAQFVTTDVARAFVDMNRSENDRRLDGVVKTHTCWGEAIYKCPLSEPLIEVLLEKYYRPYHRGLTEAAVGPVKLALDCHTMADFGPPVGPDCGKRRPLVCLSDADGTCPVAWLEALADCMKNHFPDDVKMNDPFTGGYIIRQHCREIPWIQVEISRTPTYTAGQKQEMFKNAIEEFCLKNAGDFL